MMKTALRNALLCVLFLCSSPALARDGFGVLIGTVIDQQTRLPMPGITVELYSADDSFMLLNSAVTDENGFYRLAQLPPGTYVLFIHDLPVHWPYQPYSRRVRVRLNQTYRMNVEVEDYTGD